jgi:hypothetical protein
MSIDLLSTLDLPSLVGLERERWRKRKQPKARARAIGTTNHCKMYVHVGACELVVEVGLAFSEGAESWREP